MRGGARDPVSAGCHPPFLHTSCASKGRTSGLLSHPGRATRTGVGVLAVEV